MTPFKDQSVSLIEQSDSILESAPSSSTLLYDDQRQGIEVSLVSHFLKSTKLYISSKGVVDSRINSRIVPDLDTRDLGQQINLADFSFFEDKTEKIQASAILSEGLEQINDAIDLNYFEQDGIITVFSDTGKKNLYYDTENVNKRGISSNVVSLPISDTYDITDTSLYAFQDGVETRLGIPIEGYASIVGDIEPFNEKDDLNGLDLKVEYDTVDLLNKIPTSGFTFYGAIFGTDSVVYGGRLR